MKSCKSAKDKLAESMTEIRHLPIVKLKGQPVENSPVCGHFTLYLGRILDCFSALPSSLKFRLVLQRKIISQNICIVVIRK